MSELLVKPGSWTSFTASEAEAFLASVSRPLGFTPEHQAFLKKVHEDIHGWYTPDKFYSQSLSTLIKWMPNMILNEIKKDCDDAHKKQIKLWYHELVNMSCSKQSPFYSLLIPQMTQIVDQQL